MAARPHARLKSRLHHLAVAVHALLAALELELVEDVVVRAAGEHSRLFQARLLNESEVTLHRANPAGALRIRVAEGTTPIESLTVILGVQEKLGLANDAVGPAHLGQQIIQVNHLVYRVGRPGLLAVSEGRVRNEDVALLGLLWIEDHLLAIDVLYDRSVELDQRGQIVIERIVEQVGLGCVNKGMLPPRICPFHFVYLHGITPRATVGTISSGEEIDRAIFLFDTLSWVDIGAEAAPSMSARTEGILSAPATV